MVKLNFQTLYPLHISNGNELSYNIEYIVQDEYFCKFDMNEASKIIADNNLFDFSKEYDYKSFIRIIADNTSLFDDNSFQYKIYSESSFLQQLQNERAVGKKIVQEFINSNGNFYVPGSSVKGALLTVLGEDSLGIDQRNGNIKQKFVVSDSEFIDPNNFLVDRTTDRPPSINLITMDAGTAFSLKIKKLGTLDINLLRKKLSNYSFNQIEKAKSIVPKFKSKNARTPKGADKYFQILLELSNEQLDEDEYLINLGFGGGSYFKIFENVPIPKFNNPGKRGRVMEEAHTTFAIEVQNDLFQLGWCKLKIEEE